MTQKNLEASKNPIEAIDKLAWKGQPPHLRMYRAGYEEYLNEMPVLVPGSPFLEEKLETSKKLMQLLGEKLKTEPWVHESMPVANSFDRTIIAITEPVLDGKKWKGGPQLIVARWGHGFSSPVHGHSQGFLHEEIVSGKLLVNTYRKVEGPVRVARPVKTEIVKDGTFLSLYTTPKEVDDREAYIHNFTSIGESVSAHYVPEYTRDGMGNAFDVQYFEDYYKLKPSDVEESNSYNAMYSRIGDVYLVRSQNVPDYGDHYIIITGAPTMKEHGLRPEDIAIQAPHAAGVLDSFEEKTGLRILKLKPQARLAWLAFHGILIDDNKIKYVYEDAAR